MGMSPFIMAHLQPLILLYARGKVAQGCEVGEFNFLWAHLQPLILSMKCKVLVIHHMHAYSPDKDTSWSPDKDTSWDIYFPQLATWLENSTTFIMLPMIMVSGFRAAMSDVEISRKHSLVVCASS